MRFIGRGDIALPNASGACTVATVRQVCRLRTRVGITAFLEKGTSEIRPGREFMEHAFISSDSAGAAWPRRPEEMPLTVRAAFAPVSSLAEAEAYTRQLAHSHYENFSVISVLLPKRLRQDFCNVYAFCRIADDLGDEVGDRQKASEFLAAFKSRHAIVMKVSQPPRYLSRSKERSTGTTFRSTRSST